MINLLVLWSNLLVGQGSQKFYDIQLIKRKGYNEVCFIFEVRQNIFNEYKIYHLKAKYLSVYLELI